MGVAVLTVVLRHKLSPRYFGEVLAAHHHLDFAGQTEPVLRQVLVKGLLTEHLDDPVQLVEVVRPFEEGLNAEDHAGHRAACRPDVQAVVVQTVVHQQLGAFVISARHPHVVLSVRLVVVGKAPVDQAELLAMIVNNNIEGFDIAMHDAVGMAVVQSHQDFVQVKAVVEVCQGWNQLLGFDYIWHVFVHEAWRFADAVFQDVVELDDVRTAVESLENLDFPEDLLGLDRFENFDDAFLSVRVVNSLVDFRVFASA